MKTKCFVLAAMALLVAGCPSNHYVVQLKPRGNGIERTLVFYREDGTDKNGAPNYQDFPKDELAEIVPLYPARGVTTDGGGYVAQGVFTNALPGDVGGAGAYTNLSTFLGEAGFYVERFRGNDDLAGISEKHFKAADELTDLALGWSRTELGREPGYDKLRQFLDVDLRRDLKNAGSYWWQGQFAGDYTTNAGEEFSVRFGQYLFERGYFTVAEMPGLLQDISKPNSKPLLRRIQRLVARRMGVPETNPVPPSLAFLGDDNLMKKSFEKYAATTDLFRAKVKEWQERKKQEPDAKEPEPSELGGDAVGNLVDFHFDLFNGDPADSLKVQLSLPSAPVHSNGRWDEVVKQLVWETQIEGRTNASHLPFVCHASWARPDEESQKEHLGKVALTGEALSQYCLWRCSLEARQAAEWDAFVADLKLGDGLLEKLEAFRFTGEPKEPGMVGEQRIAIPSDTPRDLLKTALR